MEAGKPELKLHNTMTQAKEVLKPINPGKIGMYVCGITAYDLSHVGHARASVFFDVLYRYLRHLGYEVTYVRNFTDVDDKVIEKANKLGKNPLALSKHYCEEYLVDMKALQCLLPTHQPRVSDHMDHIIKMIEKIIEKDRGYVVDGDVFFSVDKSPNYGQLSGQLLDHTRAGKRVAVDSRKRNPADFALWKAAKPGEPRWESPWGPGRPGWHIECSAMSSHYLSPRFDIHGGGADLKFPHHENEIAQTCAACEDSGVNYWLHNGHVTNNNVKMGKSLHNFFTIREITAKYHPLALRHFLLSAHYGSPLDYSVLQLERSSDFLYSVYQTLQDLSKAVSPHREAMRLDGVNAELTSKARGIIKNVKSDFEEKISDDLNTSTLLNGAFEEAINFITTSIVKFKKSKKKHIIKMVKSLLEVEQALRESLDLLGLLTTLSYVELLQEMKQLRYKRKKAAEEDVTVAEIDLQRSGKVIQRFTFDAAESTTAELMAFISPAGNALHYVRKTCGISESAARHEFEVLTKLRGANGVVQCVGDSVHERETKCGKKVYGFFMEYAAGGTLDAKIKTHPKGLPLAIVSSFTRMILLGLKSLHGVGFVHGHLHSCNVLLFPCEGEELEEAKVSDFGVAKKIGEDDSWWSPQNRFLGAMEYMSPESVRRGMVKESHDVWAVGCLVLEMCTNKSPWLSKSCNCNPSYILSCFERNVGPKIPSNLDETAKEFLNICLVIDPINRGTVETLLEHPFVAKV